MPRPGISASWVHNDDQGCHTLLVDPSRAELLVAVGEADRHLEGKRGGLYAGQFDLAFTGRGTPGGDLVLHDGVVSVIEIVETATSSVPNASRPYRSSDPEWSRFRAPRVRQFAGNVVLRIRVVLQGTGS